MNDTIFTILMVGAVLAFFIYKGKKGSQWGVNLKRVKCPVCQTKQPIVRMPANERQTLWGGTTCPKCKTELDKFGNII